MRRKRNRSHFFRVVGSIAIAFGTFYLVYDYAAGSVSMKDVIPDISFFIIGAVFLAISFMGGSGR